MLRLQLMPATWIAMGTLGRMPDPRLVAYQIGEVVAYIMSLKNQRSSRARLPA